LAVVSSVVITSAVNCL